MEEFFTCPNGCIACGAGPYEECIDALDYEYDEIEEFDE